MTLQGVGGNGLVAVGEEALGGGGHAVDHGSAPLVLQEGLQGAAAVLLKVAPKGGEDLVGLRSVNGHQQGQAFHGKGGLHGLHIAGVEVSQLGGAVLDHLQHLLPLIGVLAVPIDLDLQAAIGLLVDLVEKLLPYLAASAILGAVSGVEGPDSRLVVALAAVPLRTAGTEREQHRGDGQPCGQGLCGLFHREIPSFFIIIPSR